MMKIQKDVLCNGLRLITANVAGVESVTVQVFVKGGSRDEPARVSGLAHFLEHMVFKGTPGYPSAHALSSVADSIGAEINASTDKERTSFYLKLTRQHLEIAFKLLSEMVFSPLLEPQEIAREKGVIVAEISMYEDLPPQKAISAFEELMFAGSDLQHDVAGKKESVLRVERGDFVDFREKFYTPDRIVVSVAGNFDSGEVKELTEKYFGAVADPADADAVAGKPAVGQPAYVSHIRLVNKKTEQAHLIVGFAGNPLGHKDRYIESVLASLLGGGMSSRLFTEVREKRGLAYYIKSVLQHYTDTCYIGARAGVDPDKVYEALEVIVGQYDRILNTKYLVTKEELQKAKEYTKGRFILGLEDTEAVSDLIGEDELFEGRSRTLEEIVSGIDKVTREDILRVSKGLFEGEGLKLAVVGPYTETQKFEKLLRL